MKDIQSKLETINNLLVEIKSELHPPKCIIRSVDGVDLYEGDWLVPVYRKYNGGQNNGDWYVEDPFQIKKGMIYTCMESENTDKSKAFSNKEAAEKWIAEQNKPKEITIDHFAYSFVISRNSIQIYHGDSDLNLNPADINEIYAAYKSLNPSV